MRKRMTIWAAIVLHAMVFVGLSLAADDPAVLQDLTSVIGLQGQPCGQVVVPRADFDLGKRSLHCHGTGLARWTSKGGHEDGLLAVA